MGLAPNPQLVSPCAYRFVSPMLAGGVARAYGVSTSDGFFIVSMAASVALLWLTCYLAMRLGASLSGGLTAMCVIALSIVACCSNQTSCFKPYSRVKPGIEPIRC